MKATVLYTLVRIGLFAALFAALVTTGITVYLAAAIAAVLGLLISYIFFGRLRNGVAESIVRRRAAPEPDQDAESEDALLDDAVAVTPPSADRRTRRAAPGEDD